MTGGRRSHPIGRRLKALGRLFVTMATAPLPGRSIGQKAPSCNEVAVHIAGYGSDTLKQLVMAHNLGLGETRKVTLRGASLDDLAIPDWLRADRLEEWGVTASTLTSRSKDPARTQCLPLNQIIALACPTAAVCLIKWLRGRNGRPQGASHVRVP
jgi:hypothetical protein